MIRANMKVLGKQQETVTAPVIDHDGELVELDLLDLLIMIAKRKRPIALLVAASAIVATVISLLLPNRYTASTTIMPPQQTQSSASMLMSQLAGSGLGSLASLAGGSLGLKNPNDMYISMLRSRTVEDAVISKFELQKLYRTKFPSEARRKLENATAINSGKDGLINVSFEDKDPNRSAAVANTYVEELSNLMKELAVTEASQRRLFFERQLQQAKEDLSNAEVALKETQQKTGMIQLDSQSKAMIEAVGRVRAQIANKEVQLQAIGSFATEQNPDYVRAREELIGLRNQLGKFEKAPASDAADPLMAAGKIPAAGLEYVRRYREVKYREAIFEILAKQFEAAKLDEAKQAAIIQVVDPAIPPDRKSWPHRSMIVGLSVFAALLTGAFWAVGAEITKRLRANRRISTRFSELTLHMRFNKMV